MFDPNEFSGQCASYMSRFLGCPVSFIRAEILPQSTRIAPWRLDVLMNGAPRSYVLQLDPRGMEYEYQVLKAVESAEFILIDVPSCKGWGYSREILRGKMS